MHKLSTGQKKRRTRKAEKQRTTHEATKPVTAAAPTKRAFLKRLLTLFSYLSM